jgi:glycosyltransferase involved in cell wall biosynthesis
MAHISIVIPVYKAEDCLQVLYDRLRASLETINSDFEIILVEDCGGDRSWEIIVALAEQDPRVKGIQFSRNFGQHYGITAGLDHCDGDWVVVMDCDLQDRPEEIPRLYEKAQEGYDLVVGRRTERKDHPFKKLTSKLFFRVFASLTDSHIDNRIGNFGIYSREVIKSIRKLKEQTRSFGLFAIWVGFKRAEMPIHHSHRHAGKSSYNFLRRFALALNSVVAYSNKILSLFVFLGFTISSLSFLYACWLILLHFVLGRSLLGWTSLIVSIYLTAGLIIAVIGVVGIYIGKIFDEVKERPLYIIRSKTFIEDYKDD